MTLSTKHIFDIEHLPAEDIALILNTAQDLQDNNFLEVRNERPLQGKTVINLFYEPSTRTRTSFEMAGNILGAQVVQFTAGSSSLVKGETIKDTMITLERFSPHITVIRHSAPGICLRMAPLISGSIINAGDGAHEHPTQALLDLLTIRQHCGTLSGLCVAIIGDITHSRVARSNIWFTVGSVAACGGLGNKVSQIGSVPKIAFIIGSPSVMLPSLIDSPMIAVPPIPVLAVNAFTGSNLKPPMSLL